MLLLFWEELVLPGISDFPPLLVIFVINVYPKEKKELIFFVIVSDMQGGKLAHVNRQFKFYNCWFCSAKLLHMVML